MAYTVVLHITGVGRILGEIEELQKPTDTIPAVTHPRQRDGKDLHYLEHNVLKVIWRNSKRTLIEVLERAEQQKLIGFVRD